MQTEITITVKSMEHGELVNLLSTALEGSSWFGASYNREIYESLKFTQGYCFEDKLADMLLSGHQITITDYEADGESYSSKCTRITADGNAVYKIGLDDILKVASTPIGYDLLRKTIGYSEEMGDDHDEAPTGDFWTADAFLQRVVFGEEVYG